MNRGHKIFVMTLICLATASGAFQAFAEEKATPADKVAVINGTVITQAQFDKEMVRYENALAANGKNLTSLTNDEMTVVKKTCLNNIIKNELLYQECQKNGVEVDDAEVNQKFDSQKSQFASEAEFQARLKELNTDEASYKLQMKKQLAIQHLINQKFKPSVTDDEAKAFFTANPDKFKDVAFEQAKDAIVKTLSKEKIADSYNKFYTEVKDKAKIETTLK
jgi:hypothetical protein